MDPARLLEFGKKYTAAWCSQSPARVAEFYAETGSLKINDGAPSVGRTAIAAAAQGFMTAFPDMVVTMDGASIDGLSPGGTLAVTTWGKGLFEPVNSMFWDAIRRARPELHKSFNPWDRVGESRDLLRLFEESELPMPEVAVEAGTHQLRSEDDTLALIMGTGYRGVVEQLSEEERTRVLMELVEQMRKDRVEDVQADVMYTLCWTRRGQGISD